MDQKESLQELNNYTSKLEMILLNLNIGFKDLFISGSYFFNLNAWLTNYVESHLANMVGSNTKEARFYKGPMRLSLTDWQDLQETLETIDEKL